MRLRALAAIVAALFVAAPAWAQLRGKVYVSGLSLPVAFIQDPTDANVQYVVEQGGRIRTIRNGAVDSVDFLNLTSQISSGGERGLLGLAFAPDYAASGRFFVNFTNPQGNTVIARFRRSTSNPAIADPATRFDFRWPDGNRFITQPFANHNGGTIVFGPDGYLYIGMGDGGSGNDPNHNAQNPNSLLGKMLRLNVTVPDTDPEGYDVPIDNPFLDGSPIAALGEIWAFGLRNPWKFSFDDPARGGTGALLIGDVGQNDWEEIDYEPAGAGGRNYGWRNREGAHDNVTSLPPAYLPLIDPIQEYAHSLGISVIGGFVYRGTALGAAYSGRYFFGDLIGHVWSIRIATAADGTVYASDFSGFLLLDDALASVSSFGLDAAGELYVVDYSDGRVLRIVRWDPQATVDVPTPGPAVQPFAIAGWAIDTGALSGTGIDAVHVWALPANGGGGTFLGAAAYGGARPDVASAFGARFLNSGFGLTARGLSPGVYFLAVFPHSSTTQTFGNATTVFPVTVAANPRMAVDVPADAATTVGPFTVAGWAIDLAAASGTGVDRIDVWAYPNPGSGTAPMYVGAASYGGARPDVGAAFGSQFTNAGYGITVNLAPGRYQIVVFARSTVAGAFTNAMAVTVTVTSGERMSVDIPSSGQTVSTPFNVAGWALDLRAPSGTGVDTVHVWAQPSAGGSAIFLGAAAYGGSRPDVGSAFGSRFTPSGFGLTVNNLAAGTYSLIVFAHSTVSGGFTNAAVIPITVP